MAWLARVSLIERSHEYLILQMLPSARHAFVGSFHELPYIGRELGANKKRKQQVGYESRERSPKNGKPKEGVA